MEDSLTAPDPEPSGSTVEDDLLRLLFTCCHPSLAPDDPGGPGAAHPVRSHHRRGRAGDAGHRVLDGQAVDPSPAEDRAGADPLPRAARPRAAGPVGLGARRRRTCSSTRGTPPRTDRRLVRTELVGRGGPAGPAAGPAAARRPGCPGAAGPDAAPGLPDPGAPGRLGGALVLLPDQDRSAVGPGDGRRGRAAGRGGPASQPGPARPLRRPGRHRGLPRARAAPTPRPTGPPSCRGTTSCSPWTRDRSPRLNRAAAVAERDGAAAGLALVDRIEGLDAYPLWHATRAVLLRRLGRDDEAAEADRRAAALPLNEPQRQLLG